MYNPDAENMYRQESQPYQPDSTQYIPQYPQYPQYPPQSAYPANPQYPAQPAYRGYPSPPLTAENNAYAQGEKIGVRPQPQSPRRKEGNVARTSKAQALAIVQAFKKWLVIGSVMCFGVFGGLAAGHITGVTSQAGTNSATQQQAAPTNSEQGGFFQQQPPQSGGNGFGNSSTSQAPASGSSVS